MTCLPCKMLAVLALLGPAGMWAQSSPVATTASPGPASSLFEVQPGVKLEVLDWRGSGRPLVLLAGKGFTAHAFDTFAPKLSVDYHVYGITRRGYGNSSIPPTTDANYSAERLGDDVLSVIDQLKLVRPILVGHSIAGEELTSIGARLPKRVAGLVYLEAGYAYAFYDAAVGDLTIDYDTLRREMEQFTAIAPMKTRKMLLASIVDDLTRFQKDLVPYSERMSHAPENAPAPPDTAATRVDIAIFRGEQKFGGVTCPVLAIYADPHSFGDQFNGHAEALQTAQMKDKAETSAQADAFQSGNPQATVLRIANADHFIFRSNEAEVLREMKTFISSPVECLPSGK
jgi:non-heme chloroperoxidase